MPIASSDETPQVHRSLQPGLCVFALLAVMCGLCCFAGEWWLAPQVSVAGGVAWDTRRDRYSSLPGFVLGFLLGIISSAGIGPEAAVACGLFVGTIFVPINALVRAFWLDGVAGFLLIALALALMVSFPSG